MFHASLSCIGPRPQTFCRTQSVRQSHYSTLGRLRDGTLVNRDKILLHSAHDVSIPLSPLSSLKTSISSAVLFALQAAEKGWDLQVPNRNPALESFNRRYCPFSSVWYLRGRMNWIKLNIFLEAIFGFRCPPRVYPHCGPPHIPTPHSHRRLHLRQRQCIACQSRMGEQQSRHSESVTASHS